MCRFVAYMGKEALLLNALLSKPENSLINQSRQAREGHIGVNADGFGVAWYSENRALDPTPGVFKSIRPAWNDSNLQHLAAKVSASCFLGHVRASTVGDVELNNCHPFVHERYAFVHNGTIRGFDHIKRRLLNTLDDELMNRIRGNTDTEHLFFAMMQYLQDHPNRSMLDAVKSTFDQVVDWQQNQDEEQFSRLNIALTDGEQLFATRYVSKGQAPLSLYYAVGASVKQSPVGHLLCGGKKPGAVIVASEPLTDYVEDWYEVPENHFLWVDSALNLSIQAL